MAWSGGTGGLAQAKQSVQQNPQWTSIVPNPPATPAAPTTPDAPKATTPVDPTARNSALNVFTGMLQGWGLDAATAQALASSAADWQVQGYQNDAISYMITQTDAYKNRFPANAQRVAAGLPPLSPAEYLSTEASYRQIMQAAGMPKGFYDKTSDFTSLIGGDVSPQEIQDRVGLAAHLVNQTDPSTRQALQNYYGIDSSHLIAHFLDPQATDPILQKQAAAAQIGGAAAAQGLAMTDKQQAEKFADQGVTGSQALQGYGQIAGILPLESDIAQRYGQQYTQTDAENEVLGNNGLASARRAQLNQKESAQFAGDSGLANTLYGGQGRAQALAGDTTGAY